MIDPDHIAIVQGDGITTPNVLWVEIGNVNVLNDNVGCAANNTQTLALDDSLAAVAEDGLVGCNHHAEDGSVVVSDSDRRGIRLVVAAPVVLVDGILTGRATSVGVGTASLCGSGALGVGKVKGLAQDNDSGLRITEVGNELSIGAGVDWSGRTTTSDSLGKAFSCLVDCNC